MKTLTFLLMALSLVLAILVSPFASSSPDGLEKVAEEKGFIERATSVWEKAPLPDYTLGSEAAWETSLAGCLGTLLVFGLLIGGGKWLTRRA